MEQIGLLIPNFLCIALFKAIYYPLLCCLQPLADSEGEGKWSEEEEEAEEDERRGREMDVNVE